ncbi:two-component system, NtrC family, nitrogen regulation sensor histidine kinase NtrY [Gammaproteobacteria bacterium]
MISVPQRHASLPVMALSVLMLAALYLLSTATQDTAEFGRLYSWLIIINAVLLIVLAILIGTNVYQLVAQYREGVIGSRMTLRLAAVFVALSLVPASTVYYFAQGFLDRAIDSWFDARIGKTLDESLDLGRTAMDATMRERLKQVARLATELSDNQDRLTVLTLDDLRIRSGATELTLVTPTGEFVAASHADPTVVLPHRLSETVLQRVRQDGSYVGLTPEPGTGTGMQVRVALKIFTAMPVLGNSSLVLHALFPVAERLSALASSIQGAYDQYRELSYLRQPLKFSFSLTLALVLLLSLAMAVWAAFFSARHLTAPVSNLARATRAVAAGDYDVRLPTPANDELGLLVASFNDMIEKIALARDSARRSQVQVEGQRAYLEAILAHLSSGVVTLDLHRILRSANRAAGQILAVDLEHGVALEHLVSDRPQLAPLLEVLENHLTAGSADWRQEVTLSRPGTGRQVLMCHGTVLTELVGMERGQVVVLDDITTLLQAQRAMAWSEVARRLAHEIKNPLTPIQLSAERLRHKYLKRMSPEDAEILNRLTHTIIQQVEVMKEMVNAFSEYARTPKMDARPLLLNTIINEVMDLYRGHEGPTFELDLDPDLPLVEVDLGRLRQLLHNLIKNALEAAAGTEHPGITLRTRRINEENCRCVELRVEDSGPGIPEHIMERLFEPYVTTKVRGTGLGLAIVKRIIEEHGGWIWAENPVGGGAVIVVRLPAQDDGRERLPAPLPVAVIETAGVL